MGSGEGTEACDPNLIPLLDLVLQLLMLFIVCANFIQQETSSDVELPDSQSARPIEKGSADVLILNLNHEGAVVVLGRDPMKKELEIKVWLDDQYRDALRNSKDGKVNTIVILRPSKFADYEKAYEVMKLCKGAGFTSLNLRAVSLGRDET